MRISGTLTIDGGVSRLDGTRLMKGAINSGGFARATNFLQQDRDLDSGDPIFVEGVQQFFGEMPVIVITNAGPSVANVAAVGRRAGARKVSAKGSKGSGGTKKVATKRAGASSQSTRKSAKKSSGGSRALKRASKTSAKKHSKT